MGGILTQTTTIVNPKLNLSSSYSQLVDDQDMVVSVCTATGYCNNVGLSIDTLVSG